MEKIIVTGAGGGLGKAVVKQLLHDNYRVVAWIRKPEDADQLKHLSASALSFAVADLADINAVGQIARQHSDTFGIVHLAGGFIAGEHLGSTAADDYEKMQRLNLTTAFNLLREFLPILLLNKKGSIVTIGARAAVEPNGSNAVYAAAKAGLLQLTRNAAKEGIGNGVRANAILPGIIKTKANMAWGSDDQIKKWTTPESIAEVISFLMSEKAAGINDTFIKMYGDLKH